MSSMDGRQYEASFKAKVALEAVKGEKTIAQTGRRVRASTRTRSAAGRPSFWRSCPSFSPTGENATTRTGRRPRPSCTGRSASSRSSWTGLKKNRRSSCPDQAGRGRARASRTSDVTPMRTAGPEPVDVLLSAGSGGSASRRSCGGFWTRSSPDVPSMVARKLRIRLRSAGLPGQSETGTRLMRSWGLRSSTGSRAEPPGPSAQALSLSAERSGDRAAGSGLGTDITYIRLAHGFVYLVAIMDWYSRHVLSWALVDDAGEGVLPGGAAGRAADGEAGDLQHGSRARSSRARSSRGFWKAKGSGSAWTAAAACTTTSSWSGCGGSVKYEEVYLHEYRTVPEARAHLAAYFRFYNEERPHQALGYRTPTAVYTTAALPEAA